MKASRKHKVEGLLYCYSVIFFNLCVFIGQILGLEVFLGFFSYPRKPAINDMDLLQYRLKLRFAGV